MSIKSISNNSWQWQNSDYWVYDTSGTNSPPTEVSTQW